MGGAVALEVAAAHPALASAVVLLDPIPIVATPVFRERMAPFVAAINGPSYRDVLRGFAQARMSVPATTPACGLASSRRCARCRTTFSVLPWRAR